MTTPLREVRKPDFPAVVHTYTDALQVIRDHMLANDGRGPSLDQIAKATARDPSNVRRDAQKLRDAGVVEPHGALGGPATTTWVLTDKGQRWLAGIDVASGAVDPAGPGGPTVGAIPSIWPLDGFRPNPANRTLTDADIDSMADSIAANGQLQPITASPADAAGIRTIWIGHRRWMGALRARDEGRLPAELTEGLRFEERDATPAEALAMTLVENAERQDIPPLEQAFLLRDYADACGAETLEDGTPGKPLDGKSVAERLGMGVRDVQDKIRIARGASPEAIAAYRQDGSWDRLRDSIPSTRAKGEPEADDPLVVNGIRFPNTARATEAKRLAGLIPNPSNSGGGSTPRATPDTDTDPDPELPLPHPPTGGLTPDALPPGARLAMIEIAHKTAEQRRPRDPAGTHEWSGDTDADFIDFGCVCGAHWLDADVQAVIAARLAAVTQIPGGHPPLLGLTPDGLDWFAANAVQIPVSATQLAMAQIQAGAGLQSHGAYVTACLARDPVASNASDAALRPIDQVEAIRGDLWGRSPEVIAADRQLLLRVRNLALGDPLENTASLLSDLGVTGARIRGGDVDLDDIVLVGADDREILTCTVDSMMVQPTDRSRALAELIVHHLSAVLA
jgi:ParB-like nuclease domain